MKFISKHILISGITVAVLVSAGVLLWQRYGVLPPGIEHNIILTDAGFEPAELIIAQGDTIRFTTTRDKEFWPASNLHPSHGIYPEFDPREPISVSENWSFRLTKIGEWRYHDHFAPSFHGVIKVVESGELSKSVNCDDTVKGNKTKCWEDRIDATLKDQGLDKAFALVAQLYETETAFAQNCHDFAHKLGAAAYRDFAEEKDINLTAKTSYCGYGFYHGFMETLLQDTGDITKAREFCAYAGRKLYAQTVDAEGACYHGIGHGAVDGGDPRAWGDPQAMIEPALKLCRTVTGAQEVAQLGDYLYRCVTGAYNSLEILAKDSKYEINSINQEPFEFCQTQPVSYQDGCYTNMLPALMRAKGNDFEKEFRVIETIDESGYKIRAQVILDLAHELAHKYVFGSEGMEGAVALCRRLNEPSRPPCIEGLSGGHMKYGQPEQEYIRGLAFCAGDNLKSDEREICYRYILSRLRIWYTVEKSRDICNSVPKEYQKFCGQ